MGDRGMTRREMVRRTIGAGTALAAPGLLGSSARADGNASAAADASSTGLRVGPDLYQSIGVRPLDQRARHLHDHQRLADAA